MNSANCVLEWSPATDLHRVVEPLASYICANEQPKTALISALSALFREVEATNRAALIEFNNLRKGY